MERDLTNTGPTKVQKIQGTKRWKNERTRQLPSESTLDVGAWTTEEWSFTFLSLSFQEYCEGPLKDAAYHFDFKGGELAT